MRISTRGAALAVIGSILSTTTVLVASPAARADADVHRGTVSARPVDRGIHVVDGVVHAIAQVGSTVVLGGTFTQVGPGLSGAAGVVDVAAARFRAGAPAIEGVVRASVADGSGGWIVGGTFSTVGAVTRTGLARLDATGALTAWGPQVDGSVHSLLVSAGALYVGGDFSTVGGSPAAGLAKVDLDSGSLVWGVGLVGGARALAVSADGSRLFVGGTFSRVSGVLRSRLAAVSTADGALDTTFVPGPVNQTVTQLVTVGSGLYLAGDFTKVGGLTRLHLARVDGLTGALDSFVMPVNGRVAAMVVDPTGTRLYLGGGFATVGGLARPKLAVVTLTTATVGTLSLAGSTGGDVEAIALDGASALTIAGGFTLQPERTKPAVLARVDLGTGATTSVVPYAATPRSLSRAPATGASRALTVARAGGDLFVGGDFSDYGVVARSHLAAYDLATGALRRDFDPAPDGENVASVKGSADGTAVFVGGSFGAIGGVTRHNLAKVSVVDGSVDRVFAPVLDSYAKDLAVRPDGSALYVGGNFAMVNGVPTSKLTALDPVSGGNLAGFQMPLTEPTNDVSEGGARALALSPDSSRLMVIGNFRRVAGVERPLIAQIDVSDHSATVTDWRTSLYDQGCARSRVGWMRDVDVSPDGSTAYVVSSGHFYYPACDTVNAFPMVPGGDVQPTWSTKIGDTIEAVAATGDTVYIGGHFRYIETETRTQRRFQLAALDPSTGAALNWDPNAGGFLGVKVVESEPAGVFVGSDGDAIGGVAHGRIGLFASPSPGIDLRKTTSTPWVPTPGATVTFTVRVVNTFTDRPVTLTALDDQRLGSLAGRGTCSLPQTIAANGTYACVVTDPVSGSALTEVASALTATATDGSRQVSDTDTSSVALLSGVPVLRMRSSIAPSTVSFPQGEVGFGLTVMNLSLTQPVTLTALTSPTYGTLTSACGLPVTVQPNRLLSCRLTRPVSGDVGARPSISFSVTGSSAQGAQYASASSTVTIAPPPAGTPVALVVADPALLTPSEAKLKTRLDPSYDVHVVDDGAVTPQLVAGMSVVVLGGSVDESTVGALRTVATPMLVTRNQLLDELAMAPAADQGQVTGTTVGVSTPVHPLAATLTGTVTVNNRAKLLYWGRPAPAATVIAEAGPGQPVLFAYRPGATLTDGSAAAECRVYWSAAQATSWTAQAGALFDRAVAYAAAGCGRNMLWTAIGNGGSTWAGDGTVATATGLNQPWGIAVSPAGEVYVADLGAHAVHKLTAAGTLVTVAGTGSAGFSGDGGPATTARLSSPARVAFDAAGALYIADSGNNRIRRVSPSGTISTVAGTGSAGSGGDGGQATSAQLRTPFDVTVASDGTLYIADRGNNKVRKVTPTGVIATVAGTGSSGYNGDGIRATSARLTSPFSVALGPDGTLYVADYDNERVRAVDPFGYISTVAGTGLATAAGDGGLATDAGLHKPAHVVALPNGDLLISEVNNNRVRKVHDGLIETLAGTGQFGYVGDGGPPIYSTWQRPAAVAVDAQGTLWVVDRNNRRVRVVNAS